MGVGGKQWRCKYLYQLQDQISCLDRPLLYINTSITVVAFNSLLSYGNILSLAARTFSGKMF